jgi:hypothetical protein
VRITSGFGGGEFTKTLRKVCTCQKLKFAFLLLEYCKIRECYAVANAFKLPQFNYRTISWPCFLRVVALWQNADVSFSLVLYPWPLGFFCLISGSGNGWIHVNWNLLFYCSNIAKSENAMLWRMLSRLETCIVYCCIWSVALASALSEPISSSKKTRKWTVCRFL